MSLADPLPIIPWRNPCRGTVRVPGSKSLTNRALILAALSDRTLVLSGALFSRDSALLVQALQALGFKVIPDPERSRFTVKGEGGKVPSAQADIFVGNAGTAARFLTALVCLHPNGLYHFDGDPEMQRRPMQGLIDALESLGARFTFHGRKGCFPFTVKTRGLQTNVWRVDARASSQMLSALLMIAPFAGKSVRIEHGPVRPAFIDMTARLMEHFGAVVRRASAELHEVEPLPAFRPRHTVYEVEPDATAASYFLALPLVVGGSLTIEGIHSDSLQGDVAFAGVLRNIGMAVVDSSTGWTVSAPGSAGCGPQRISFETFSDTFLTLASVAPLLPESVTLTGIEHTRYQECDRIDAITTELKRAGFRAECGRDFVSVYPVPGEWRPPSEPTVVRTYLDHRVAMSLAILGCRDMRGDGKPWMAVADPSCAGKTFPGFFDVLKELYWKSHDEIQPLR